MNDGEGMENIAEKYALVLCCPLIAFLAPPFFLLIFLIFVLMQIDIFVFNIISMIMLMRCLLCCIHFCIFIMIIKMSMIEYELKYSYVVFIRILWIQ